MTEYLPETSICAVQLDTQTHLGNEDSSDTTSEAVPIKIQEPTDLGRYFNPCWSYKIFELNIITRNNGFS